MLTLLPGIALNLLLAALNGFGVNVPSNITALVTQLVPVVQKLISDISAGGSPSTETITIVQELVPAIQAVRMDTSLDPIYTEWASLLEEMVVNVTLADAAALKGVDPTKLHAE
jgi:hypothetical protein